jgi:hypothetical protein
LRALLLVFLRDDGALPLASGRSQRPDPPSRGPHRAWQARRDPLRELIDNYLALPPADLSARPGGVQGRDLDPERFSASPPPRARVLLLDDTWTTGSSAQSAAMALRRAGARSVIFVVLGRHVGRATAVAAGVDPATMPFREGTCAVHDAAAAHRWTIG